MNKQIKLNIHEIEQLLWSSVLETFQQAMVEILSMLDDFLMATRNKSRYEYKEKKKRTYVTKLGSITIHRRYYWDKDNKEWVFLLDRALGLDTREQISPGLKELVVLWATKGPSYRDVRDRLKDLFGHQVLSHEKIRQTLLQASDTLEDTEREVTHKKRVDTLFIEADGFWTGVQHKGRRSRRKRETHLAVVHEGWEKRQGLGHKADYRLENPTYITTIADSEEDIWEETWLRLNQKYKDLDQTTFIINAESNVDRFKLRTAKRGRAWSKKGLKAILRMLGLLYENTLQDFVKELNIDLARKVDTEKLVVMSAGKVAKTVGRKTLGAHQGGFPAVNRGTQGYAKLFKNILNPDPVY